MFKNRFKDHVSLAKPAEDQDSNQLFEAVQPALERVGDSITNAIRRQPLAGIAVGLIIGVALGCVVKRR